MGLPAPPASAVRALLVSVVVVVAAAGCGPVRSTSILVDAQAELDAARAIDAPKAAPYEFVAAEAYLAKAREEQSRADFEESVRLAEVARDCARAARRLTEVETRKALTAEAAAPRRESICRAGPFKTPPPRTGPAAQADGANAATPSRTAAPSPSPTASPSPAAPLPEGDSP